MVSRRPATEFSDPGESPATERPELPRDELTTRLAPETGRDGAGAGAAGWTTRSGGTGRPALDPEPSGAPHGEPDAEAPAESLAAPRGAPAEATGAEYGAKRDAARISDFRALLADFRALVADSWALAAAPSLVFLAVRATGLLMLAWQVSANRGQLSTRLALWDGQWLLAIAGGGYDGVPGTLVDAFGRRGVDTPLAFFPGYPIAVSVTRFVTGSGLVTAGLLVSLAAGLVLAHGLARIGELVPGGSRRVGLLLVALVAAAPMGVVWSMTYSEGLFCACAVWALVAVLRRNWVLAGWCAALAGLVRPTAFALLLAVGLAALVAVAQRRDGWRPWAGGLLATLGLLGYLGFVAARTGSPLGWFVLQRRGWNSKFDGGKATLAFSRDVLATGRSVLEVVTVAALAGSVLLLVLCLRSPRRGGIPWPLWVYAAGVLVMDLGANGLMNSKARLLLPAVTLLVPVALGLAKRRPGTVYPVLFAAALASAWFGGYALTGWQYAI